MKIRDFKLLFLSFLILSAGAALAASDHYQVVGGPKDFYYGHISYIDQTAEGPDPVVSREGKSGSVPGLLNLPIGPGDTIRTSGGRRCEIQFDTGTLLRLDFDTELKIETILARSLSTSRALSNLSLKRGRLYIMYKEYANSEMFQVLTPRAAVKLRHGSVAMIGAGADGVTETQVKVGKAEVLFGPSEKMVETLTVGKGNRLFVGKDDAPKLLPDFEGSPFELWNTDINARFLDLHEGKTPIPQPIRKYPQAVQYFAQVYGSLYGEWMWDGLFGYVWRPYLNDTHYPAAGGYSQNWQPFNYGQWSVMNGQMFWVPMEPWGWVPYHLGVWHWNKKLGWVWIPGSAFAPAWADWWFFFAEGGRVATRIGYWGPISIYAMMEQEKHKGLTPVPEPSLLNPRFIRNNPRYGWWLSSNASPVPTTIVRNLAKAYKKGDPQIREEAALSGRQGRFFVGDDPTSPATRENILTWEQAEQRGLLAEINSGSLKPAEHRQVIAMFSAGAAGRRAPNPTVGPAKNSEAALPAPSKSAIRSVQAPVIPRAEIVPVRFRDWNPDLDVARRLGVRIEYSSGTNEIRCPQLNLSSLNRSASGTGPSLASRASGSGGSDNYSSGMGSSSGSTGSSSSSSSAAATRGSGRTDDRSGSQSTRSSGSSGAVKK